MPLHIVGDDGRVHIQARFCVPHPFFYPLATRVVRHCCLIDLASLVNWSMQTILGGELHTKCNGANGLRFLAHGQTLDMAADLITSFGLLETRAVRNCTNKMLFH